MIGMVGAGRLGAQAALELASQGVDDIALVDIVEGLAEGEALDISHKISETGVDVSGGGSNDYSTLRGSDVGVVSAGLARQAGMARMGPLAQDSGVIASGFREGAQQVPGCLLSPGTNPI